MQAFLVAHSHSMSPLHTTTDILNRDRKRCHASCILPVQLMSLVGNEIYFALTTLKRMKIGVISFQFSLLFCCFVKLRATLVETIKWPVSQEKFIKLHQFGYGCMPS